MWLLIAILAQIILGTAAVFDKFYDVEAKGNAEILIEELGKKKGFMKKGGEVDEDRTSRFIIRDWQEGRIKR